MGNTTDEIDQITVTVGRTPVIVPDHPDGPIFISQEEAGISKTIFANMKGEFLLENFEK